MSIDRTKYLSKTEVKLLRTTIRNAAIVAKKQNQHNAIKRWMLVDFALSTGFRVREIANVKIKDIDFERHLIKVTRLKRKKPIIESFHLEDKFRRHLKRYIGKRKAGALFQSSQGRDISAQQLQNIWKRAIKDANLPKELSIHSARHTVATQLYSKTKDMALVQKFLGHVNIATTMNVYAAVTDEDMHKAQTNLYED